MPGYVVVEKKADGTLRVRERIDTELIVVDIPAMTADPKLAIGYIQRLLSTEHPNAAAVAQELLAWYESTLPTGSGT